MPKPKKLQVLLPSLQVTFFHRLQVVRQSYLHEALSTTVGKLRTSEIDSELAEYVSNASLSKLASYLVRGEAVFPVPVVLATNPFLLGYYRLLFGLSQKETYNMGHLEGSSDWRNVVTYLCAREMSCQVCAKACAKQARRW